MSFIGSYLAVALLALGTAQEAQVLKPDADGRIMIRNYDAESISAWAKCAWERMPVSAQNLVDYQANVRPTPDNKYIPFASAVEVLNWRLNKVCGELLLADHRNSIRPLVKSAKRRILREKRPEPVEGIDQQVDVYLCAQSLSGKYLLTERELERPRPNKYIPNAKVECYSVEPDGSLKNA